MTDARNLAHGTLKRSLGPVMLWGLGVGYVISGMYFGWNLGLPEGGPYGLLAALLLMSVMYLAFVFSYAELSCMMPQAGGAFVYGNRALGTHWGFIAGAAQIVEFVFAPPAIAAAIGAYFNLFFPTIPPLAIALGAYVIFTGVNIYGVKASAVFELVVTVLAVVELLIFAGVTLPAFHWSAFSKNALPHGWSGIFPAIPYAIWFYLGIEGVANVAEETENPQRDLARGFGTAMITLVVLALLTFFAAVGVNGWESVVYKAGTSEMSDSPLPMALRALMGEGSIYYHLLISIGLCGLLASFHGIILCAGRATFEFGRVGYAPRILGRVHPLRGTPDYALIANMGVGLLALLSGHTSEIITISVFGAITLYGLSMISLFRLRALEPATARPYRVPLYPVLPAVALGLAVFSLVSMAYFNRGLSLVYLGIMTLGYLWFTLIVPRATRVAQAVAIIKAE